MTLSPFLGPFTSQTSTGECLYEVGQQAFRLRACGGDHFIWRTFSGDFCLTMRANLQGMDAPADARLGWMARADLDPATPYITATVQGDGLAALHICPSPAFPAKEMRLPISRPDVLQLERRGATFYFSAARYGEAFTTIQAELELPPALHAGLFMASPGAPAQGLCQDVRLVIPAAEPFDRAKDPFASRLEVLDLASGHRRLIHSADSILEAPNWTRDGKSLIYNSGGRLIRFDLDSNRPTRIDTGWIVLNNNDHVLSFDGTILGISSHSPEDSLSRIYVLPISGGMPQLVTRLGPSYLHGWAPDGQSLVYCAQRNGQYDLYSIPLAGGEETQLTDTPGLDDGPEYSPDGRYIYFNSVRSGSMQIWRMRPDGSAPEQLTDDDCNNWFPHVSPDGASIVFVSYLPGEVEPGDHPPAKRVYIRQLSLQGSAPNGGTPKVLAYLYGGQGTMNVPSWSPDGSQLAFVSNTVPFLDPKGL